MRHDPAEQLLSDKGKDRHQSDLFLQLTASIVGAYVSHNAVIVRDLPNMIMSVHNTLKSASAGPFFNATKTPEAVPAVPIRKSVADEYIICLENGGRYKSLRRHLRTAYGMSPDDYRKKWNLPPDYPMTAPAYTKVRSNLAKESGLGRKRQKAGASEKLVLNKQ